MNKEKKEEEEEEEEEEEKKRKKILPKPIGHPISLDVLISLVMHKIKFKDGLVLEIFVLL